MVSPASLLGGEVRDRAALSIGSMNSAFRFGRPFKRVATLRRMD